MTASSTTRRTRVTWATSKSPQTGPGGYGYIPPYFPPPGYTPPPADGFNLRLDKQADPETCDVTATGFNCQYTIRVTNTGPGFYWGPLQVDRLVPAEPARCRRELRSVAAVGVRQYRTVAI